jgi:hypothetical protein
VKDSISVHLFKYSISKKIIDSLYTQLSTTKLNFTSSYIRPFLKPASKGDIIGISKKIDKHYVFKDYYGAELTERINAIKRFNKIDSFINLTRPDPQWSIVRTDVWEGIEINFIKNKDTTIFYADLLQPLGQPVLKKRENNHFIGTQIVNLEINNLLEGILPIFSIVRKRVGINNLTEDYIKWYIDKVL